jgi:hypothetical protein
MSRRRNIKGIYGINVVIKSLPSRLSLKTDKVMTPAAAAA